MNGMKILYFSSLNLLLLTFFCAHSSAENGEEEKIKIETWVQKSTANKNSLNSTKLEFFNLDMCINNNWKNPVLPTYKLNFLWIF